VANITEMLEQLWQRGVRIFRPSPNYGVGGGQTLTITAVGHALGPLQACAKWQSGDGVSKPVTIVATAACGAFPTDGLGAMCKIRFSDERGSSILWMPVPGIRTVVARDVSVQAQIVGTPYGMSSNRKTGVVQPRTVNSGEDGVNVAAQIVVLIRDESPADVPPSTMLLENTVLQSSDPNGFPGIDGPVYITSFEINNQNTSPIAVIWGEGSGLSPFQTQIRGSVIVPAQGSIAIGEEMLGAFAYRWIAECVTDLTLPTTESPDAGAVTCNVQGYYLPLM
jgi:hypothetical protein